MGSASGVCGERRTRTQSVERQPTTPASSKATSTTQTPADPLARTTPLPRLANGRNQRPQVFCFESRVMSAARTASGDVGFSPRSVTREKGRRQ